MSYCRNRSRALLVVASLLVLPLGAGTLAAADKGKPRKPAGDKDLEPLNAANYKSNVTERRLKLLLDYYAEMYSKHLGSRDPFVRALAVTALGLADAKQTTEPLLSVVWEERDPVVKLIAWETLHARTRSLDAKQYDRWIEGGLDAALKGVFRGDLRVGLIGAMASYGPGGFRGKCARVAKYFTGMCRAGSPHDKQTLAALKALNWDGKGAAKGTGRKYKGVSKYIDPPTVITDPNERRWLNEMELGDLTIQNFDLCFVIDCTGSMLAPMQWVARDVGKMMRVFEFISRRPRIGVVYFRHEIDRRLMAPCCAKFKRNKPGEMFATKYYTLTSSVSSLSSRMLRVDPRGGNYLHPGGAVHGGLYTALKKQPWSSGAKARKAIVLIGDSPVTPKVPAALPAAKNLAAEMHKRGFVIHGILLKDLPSYAQVVKAGGGDALRMSFGQGGGKLVAWGSNPWRGGKGGKGAGKGGSQAGKGGKGGNAGKRKRAKKAEAKGQKGAKDAAAAGKGARAAGRAARRGRTPESPYTALVGAIVRPLLPEGHRKLVDPLVDILLIYADAEPPRR